MHCAATTLGCRRRLTPRLLRVRFGHGSLGKSKPLIYAIIKAQTTLRSRPSPINPANPLGHCQAANVLAIRLNSASLRATGGMAGKTLEEARAAQAAQKAAAGNTNKSRALALPLHSHPLHSHRAETRRVSLSTGSNMCSLKTPLIQPRRRSPLRTPTLRFLLCLSPCQLMTRRSIWPCLQLTTTRVPHSTGTT